MTICHLLSPISHLFSKPLLIYLAQVDYGTTLVDAESRAGARILVVTGTIPAALQVRLVLGRLRPTIRSAPHTALGLRQDQAGSPAAKTILRRWCVVQAAGLWSA